MTDESQPQLPLRPPLPEQYTIPYQTIGRWLDIPNHATVTVTFTRSDWDYLYSAFDKSLAAQLQSQQTLILYSQGKLAEANATLYEAQRQLVESQNAFRRFFNAVMTSVERQGG